MNAFTSSTNAGTVKTAMVSSSSPSSSNVICEEEKLTSSLSLAGMKFSCGGGFGSTVPSGRMLPICKGTFTSSLSLGGVKFDCGGVDSAISSGRMLPIMLTSSLPLGGVKFDCDGVSIHP
ncbi:unnamed protein product [Rhizophagus irregularis]|uniref:Uncharacterized protein n=1 Tax=Rhizophagus irregularis TaxID=588596 RepID=A0A915YP45_9GLOM|nr:unnamed protein product [Rhizophagus irregularis]